MKALPRTKLAAGAAWLTLLAIGFVWAQTQDRSPAEILAWLFVAIDDNPWAAVIYVIIYAIRPLLFFPAMWLTIASGSLFGFLPGVMLTIIGENTSAATAYTIARFFRAPSEEEEEEAVEELSPFRRLLAEQALPTVIVLRAAYLPFDLVNYGCGLLRVPWWPYFIGTFIGILPPMITFVSFGASIELQAFARNLDNFEPAMLFDWEQLLISGALLAGSLVIAWFAHRRHQRLT